ncbi:MAG: valine--tRNA ligase [Patescibacteria group bacterium]|jgi:valyl-tRNA synthetase
MAKKTIEKTWEPKEFEEKIYQKWESSGYFKPEINMKGNSGKVLGQLAYDREVNGKPFVISMPPPNVTGKLHMGHGMVVTVEDIMARYHRLLGEPTLWLPGTDHAGIATQTVVDKALRKEGINKNDLGREKFVEKVWEWKGKYGDIITSQIRRLGASCDWSRERFTLDDGLSLAVRRAFVDLYGKGLIYRGEYIVNWCPRCHTAIADDEVEHVEQKSKLYYFKYDKNFPITIATTRPETKLGDTAVAVNPSDKRYQRYIGKSFDVEIDGNKRQIKVVADRAVDAKFGTGAVGVTPAHSMVDWRMAEEHDLPVIKVINEEGRMTDEAGENYTGLKVTEAKEKLIAWLSCNNLLEKEDEYLNNLSVCYRCGGAVEPLPSKQWFVKMRPLAEKAKKVVEDGTIKIIPERFDKIYFHWMDNIRDWCISRQLWWGHQIPVWYKKNEKGEEEVFVGMQAPDGAGWVQDPDVLDTWFSSGLWPFSTLGWPDNIDSKKCEYPLPYAPGMTTCDYNYFYPTTVMETAYDIIFFWVARMIMFGLEFTGKAPFETVYFHGLVRDEHNRKMSKSLGNALDPLDLIPKYGTDAIRMALTVGSTPGQDIPVGEGKIKGFRNFSNKIWNASRYVMLRASEGDLKSGELGQTIVSDLKINGGLLTDADRDILKQHEEVKKKVTEHLNKFKFSLAGELLYDYFWHTFADVYIEASKGQLGEDVTAELNNNTRRVLLSVLSETLVMLHPFMPFVTEAVWQDLREVYPSLSESIMIAEWPG